MSDNDDEYHKDNANVAAFFTTLGINLALGFLALATFFLLRPLKLSQRLGNLRRFYTARTKGQNQANRVIPFVKRAEYHPMDKEKLHLLTKSKRPWRGWGSWVWTTVCGYRDEDLLRTHGADATMFIIFLRNTIGLMLGIMVPGLGLFIPMNATGTNRDLSETNPKYVEGLNVVAFGNSVGDRQRMAVYITFLWLFSLWMFLFVFLTYRSYVLIRKKWLKMNNARAYTIMVEEIPNSIKTNEDLMEFFSRNFPFKPISARIVCKGDLPRNVLKKWKKHINIYEKQLLKQDKTTLWGFIPWSPSLPGGTTVRVDNPQIKTGYKGWFIGLIGKKADAFPWLKSKIRKYEQYMYEMREQMNNPTVESKKKLKRTHVGFVTFDNVFVSRIKGYLTVNSYIITANKSNPLLMNMSMRPAPDYSDVFWDHLNVTRFWFWLRSLLIITIAIVLIFLWFWPTVFIAAVSNLSYLSSLDGFGWLDWVNDAPGFFRGLITGTIPAFALFILYKLVYPILKFVVFKFQGHHLYSNAAWTVLVLYWLFMLINVVFIYTIGGSLFQLIDQAIDDPSSIIKLISTSLAAQALFFTQYIFVAAFFSVPLSYTQFGAGIKQGLCLLFCAGTPRKAREHQLPGSYDYSGAAAQHMIIFCLMLAYCLLNPLVTFAGWCYFVLAYIGRRYSTIYIHIPQWESGAKIWPVLFHIIMFCILLFQAVMIGLISINEPDLVPALVFPPIGTVLLWLGLWLAWHTSTEYGPIADVSHDRYRWRPRFANTYIDPALRPDMMMSYDFDKSPDENVLPKGKSAYGWESDDEDDLEDGFAEDGKRYDEEDSLLIDEAGKGKQRGRSSSDIEMDDLNNRKRNESSSSETSSDSEVVTDDMI